MRCACGRTKGLSARPLETFGRPLQVAFSALRRTAACVGMRLRAHQRAFRSPFGNLRMSPCRGLYVRCGALPLGRGMRLWAHQRAFRSPFGNLRMSPSKAAGTVRRVALDVQESRPALRRRPTSLSACERPLAPPALLYSGDRGEGRGMRLWAHQRAFRSPFGNLRMPLAGGFMCEGGAQPLGQGMRLRAHQRAFRSPFGNLRVSPSMAAGTVRRVALDVQESRPALRRRPTSLSACERPLAPPALLYSGDRGELLPLLFCGSFVVAIIIVMGASLFYGNGYDAVLCD